MSEESFNRRRWKYQQRHGTRPKENITMATNQNAPPPTANAGGAGTNPQMVARAYSALGRLINEGGLPPRAVKILVQANTKLLSHTLEAKGVVPAAAPVEEPDVEGEVPFEEDDDSPDSGGSPMIDPDRAVEAMNANIAKEAADVPETKRTLAPSPFAQKSIRQWAQGEGARRAGLPRPQRRG